MDRLKNFLGRAVFRAFARGQSEIVLTSEGIRPIARTLRRRGMELANLLGRPAINLDTPELQRFLAGKTVLVTGAGGSIGSEICRQMMRFCPQRVVLVERTENNLFEIDRELRERWVGADIRPCIADVCDEKRITQIFQTERPQVVFHCAAHKHVPMMEHNPCEAIKNNVFGTKMVADAALAAGASAFVLISSDKAVNPSSVMGATKRVAEIYIQSLNGEATRGRRDMATKGIKKETEVADVEYCSSIPFVPPSLRPSVPSNATKFVAVRFGNVLGSSGSVVPIFQKQIEAGGPVTVTHPEMRRFFMTIPEASQLVMQAGAIAKGGEVFVLDMGSQVKIVDLARQLIIQSGLVPDDDIHIKFTGVRPGEKLYEELACDDEQTRPTSHEKIRAYRLSPMPARQVNQILAILAAATAGSPRDAVEALAHCVPEYRPDSLPRGHVPVRLISAA